MRIIAKLCSFFLITFIFSLTTNAANLEINSKLALIPLDEIYQNIFIPVLFKNRKCSLSPKDWFISIPQKKWAEARKKYLIGGPKHTKKFIQKLGLPDFSDKDYLFIEKHEKLLDKSVTENAETLKKCTILSKYKISAKFFAWFSEKGSSTAQKLLNNLDHIYEENSPQTALEASILIRKEKVLNSVCQDLSAFKDEIKNFLKYVLQFCLNKTIGHELKKEQLKDYACREFSDYICSSMNLK